MMKYKQVVEEKLNEIKTAAYEAGKKIIENGKFNNVTLRAVSQPLVPLES